LLFLIFKKCSAKTVQIPFCPWNIYLWIMTCMGKHVWRFFNKHNFLCFWFSRNVLRKQSRYLSVLEIYIYELWHAWESMFNGFLINTIFLCFWFSRNVLRKQSRYLSVLEIYIYELWHAWESMFNGFLINTIFLCFWFSRNVLQKQSRYLSVLEIYIYELWHAWESMFDGFLINTIFLCFWFSRNVLRKTVQIPFCPWNIYLWIMTCMGKHV